MFVFFKIILVAIVLIYAYYFINRLISSKLGAKKNERTLLLLDHLINNYIQDNSGELIKSKSLTGVWGNDIYVFEYIFKNEEKLVDNLSEYVKTVNKNKILPHKLVITDTFTLDNNIHIDFAYLSNLATYDYVLDINELNKIN